MLSEIGGVAKAHPRAYLLDREVGGGKQVDRPFYQDLVLQLDGRGVGVLLEEGVHARFAHIAKARELCDLEIKILRYIFFRLFLEVNSHG